MLTAEHFNRFGEGHLPGHLGMIATEVTPDQVRLELPISSFLLAPNGYLHAGAVVALADTAAGYGCAASLPEAATGFTTIELKSNHTGTARDGTIEAVATNVHRGRTTQVWDAVVRRQDSGKIIALFRCTQLILYAKPDA